LQKGKAINPNEDLILQNQKMLEFLTNELAEEKKKNEAVGYEKDKSVLLQKEILTKLAGRINLGNATCKVLSKYLSERVAATTKYIKALGDLPKLYQGSSETQSGYVITCESSNMCTVH
jgi:hypothetical protein